MLSIKNLSLKFTKEFYALEDINIDDIIDIAKSDKKMEQGQIKFILLKKMRTD